MKKIILNTVLLLNVLLVLVSCEPVSNGKLIIEDGAYYSSYEVYENKERDTTNKFSYEIGPELRKLKNTNIESMIKILDEQSYIEKEFEFKKVEDTFSLDILFEDSFDDIQSKEIINRVIAYYNLKLDISTKTEDYWELYIKNENKIKKFECESKLGTNRVEKKDSYIIIDCMNLYAVVGQLKNYGDKLIFKGDYRRAFKLQFLDGSLAKNQENFEKYGLAVRPIKQEVGVYTISKK